MLRFAFLLSIFTLPAQAWWCEGHQMVAYIAGQHLTPAAKSRAYELLRTNPADPSLQRFCKNLDPDPLMNSSTWADDVKRTEGTGQWHYMDLPVGMNHGNIEAFCRAVGPSENGRDRPGCILSALRYNLNIVRNQEESDAERAKALRYLIHLVGDLHQPLHTTANNDQGGNCLPIQFFDDPTVTNLHSVWDGMLVNRDTAASSQTLTDFANKLNTAFENRREGWTKAGVTFDKWAWESHKIAQKVTYGDLKPKVPVEKFEERPDCKVESERFGALKIRVGDAYQAEAAPVIEEQIAKAGFRLAELLNSVFP